MSSKSECSLDSSEYVSAVEENSISEFLPYDDNVEPIATEEEIENPGIFFSLEILKYM